MVTKSTLQGMKVLVTRPEQQAQNLIQLIQSAGGEVIAFPVIDIAFQSDPILEHISQQRWDKVIFISRNAVNGFFQQVGSNVDLTAIELVCVGSGTAQELELNGFSISLFPLGKGGSEDLLSMPEMQTVNGQNILIIRGVGGRELLADTLLERGAKVTYAQVYDRVMVEVDNLRCAQAHDADILLCTSQQGVSHLVELLNKNQHTIWNKRLLVFSERIQHFAQQLGFTDVHVTTSTSDEAVIDALLQMDK